MRGAVCIVHADETVHRVLACSMHCERSTSGVQRFAMHHKVFSAMKEIDKQGDKFEELCR